jgi:hypothetical protein
MSDTPSFAKLVPGFDFLQGLARNAGAALPSMGQWVAPTLNPDELRKRIDELKTVQFWLEQNAKMLGTTIQALEVQRMTLSTLQTMNVQMADLRDAMKIPAMPAAGFGGAEELMKAARGAMGGMAAPAPAGTPAAPEPAPAPAPAAASEPAPSPAAGVVDPMQWWGALTKQFTQLATSALSEGAADAAKTFAGAMMPAGTPAGAAAPAAAAKAPAAQAAAKAPARKTAARKGAAAKGTSRAR